MKDKLQSRRSFLKTTAVSAGAMLLERIEVLGSPKPLTLAAQAAESKSADYSLRIKVSPVEIAANRILSLTTYNGQFPGPLIRLKEGQPVTVDVFNDTDVAEQLHWHGQMLPVDVDGASEEGTPFIPAHSKRTISFTPRPAGFRFYHTHNRAGSEFRGRAVQRPSRPGVYRRQQ